MFIVNPEFEWDVRYLISWGADYGPLTLGGEFWRLFTSTFVHINPIHIASNMVCLLWWGTIVERGLGSGRFLVAYCALGVCASFTSVIINPDVVSAGASGAIAGVFGIMCMMRIYGHRGVTNNDVIGNLVANVVLAFMGGVDWVAHLGGFVGGLLLGAMLLGPGAKGQVSNVSN